MECYWATNRVFIFNLISINLLIKSMLMLPQILENYKQKRVKGLSHLLVFLNFVGDLMKFGYFIVNVKFQRFRTNQCSFLFVE